MIELTEIKYKHTSSGGITVRYIPHNDIDSIIEYIKSKGYSDLKVNGKAVK